jgi:outer membrane protein assembly factor BamB
VEMRKYLFLILISTLPSFGNWPQYHGPFFDKSANSEFVNTNILENTLWKAPAPLGFSSFSMNHEYAYTLIAEEDADGLLWEWCIAIELSSGKRIWSSQLGLASYGHGGGNAGTSDNSGGDGPRSTPSIGGERVFVYDSDMTLHALSAKSGEVLWKADLIKEFSGKNIMWKNASSPLLTNGLVVVCGGGPGQSFLAFDQSSGKIRWKNGDETPTHATPALASIDGVNQIIFLCRSGLIGINPKDGSVLWKQDFPFKVSTAASPVVAGNYIFCSAGYGVGAGLFKVSKKNSSWETKPVWRKRNELMNHWSTPLYFEGKLYGIFGFKEYGKAPLQCIDLMTGKILWSKEGFGPGNLIRCGKKLLVLSDDGQLVTVLASPDQYVEISRDKLLQGKCWSTPILSSPYLLARSTKEAVAIRFKD